MECRNKVISVKGKNENRLALLNKVFEIIVAFKIYLVGSRGGHVRGQ